MAALMDQPISINYGKGIDSKTDPKTVQIGKMLRLENALFTAGNRINKRNGFDSMSMSVFGGGTVSSPLMTSNFINELVCAAPVSGATLNGQRLLSYSVQENRWVDAGKYTPVKVNRKYVSQNVSSLRHVTGTLLNNIAIFAWNMPQAVTPNQGRISFSVWDMNTETAMASNQFIDTGTADGNEAAPICVLLGGTQPAIIYQAGTSAYKLFLRTITVSPSGGVTLGPQVTLATLDSLLTNTYPVAAAPTATGAAISYADSSGSTLTTITVDTTGAITHTATISTTPETLALAVDPVNGNIWVYWAGTAIKVAIYDPSLSVVLSATTVFTPSRDPGRLVAISMGAALQQVAYSYNAANNINHVFQFQVNSSGSLVVGNTGLCNGCTIYSQFFLVDGVPYLAVNNADSATQATMFIMDATITSSGTSGVVARTLQAIALDTGAPSTPITLSPTKILIPASTNVQPVNPLLAVEYVTLDFDNFDTAQAVSTSQALLINGGLITAYDGQTATELGFNLFPEVLSISNSTTGGSLVEGSYQVFAVYQWFDAQGNLHQSAPSPARSIVVPSGTSTNKITVTVPYLTLTQKKSPRQEVGIAIYITEANGLVPHLFLNSSTSPASNTFPNISTVSAAQGLLSVDITSVTPSNQELYTTGGVLDNDVPPPTTAVIFFKNRVWLVDSEEPNTIWYSKSIQEGVGISFSGLLIEQIDRFGGVINALAGMDDKVVILERNNPIVISGDGANDLGQGSTLTFPQVIPSDVGCTTSKGALVSPLGVHFKTPKGLYLLDRSTTLKYWGAPVQGFNSEDITSSLVMPGTTELRFLTSTGLSLSYDYFYDQWGTFTNFTGLSSAIWNGKYVYARTDGSIFLENFTSFLDASSPFAVRAQTAWLKGSVVQGFQRLKEFLQLGDYTNGSDPAHGMQVSIAYDYLANLDLPAFTDPVAFTFGNASVSGPFQYRQFLEQQKCEAATFLIEEVATGASGESMNLGDMTVLMGVKKGAFKLPSAQTAS